jgi:hypothetical protein
MKARALLKMGCGGREVCWDLDYEMDGEVNRRKRYWKAQDGETASRNQSGGIEIRAVAATIARSYSRESRP